MNGFVPFSILIVINTLRQPHPYKLSDYIGHVLYFSDFIISPCENHSITNTMQMFDNKDDINK